MPAAKPLPRSDAADSARSMIQGVPTMAWEPLVKLRYRWWPDHLLGEILSKRWTETAIPVLVLALVASLLATRIDGFFSEGNLAAMLRQAGEVGLIALGMTLVVIVGGIDLSVGSIFALCNFAALLFIQLWDWPVAVAVPATVLVGAVLGAFNGILIGYLRLRAFLTTLISLIIFRSVYDILILRHSAAITSRLPESEAWNLMGGAAVLGLDVATWTCLLLAIACHVLLTRLRPGWHIMAIGGSRRAAHNAGVPVARTVALCYVASGTFTALSAVFFAARLGTLGGDVGAGLELTVLTATVVGGLTLGGGRGSVTKMLVGLLVVLLIINGLTSVSARGGVVNMALAAALIIASVIDIRWNKNRQKLIRSVYVSPGYLRLPDAPAIRSDSGTVWQVNKRLREVEIIGLGQVEGPEDVILDREGHLYCGSRQGDIVRFFAPDFQRREVYAHIGGQTLGLSFDREQNLYVCSGGMGLYRVTPQREVQKVSDETRRSLTAFTDDSRLRLADDLDIAPDGRVFFSEATIRYEMSEHMLDVLEGRGNGRIVCWDPRTNTTRTLLSGLRFPNGICCCGDNESLLFALTTGCAVMRYWYDGPRKGRLEAVLPNLPGHPDNINPASDGNFWLALVGIRSPALDLAYRMPGFRRRMTQRLPVDEWLIPQINNGCVLKFSLQGEVLETLWDDGAVNHPMITSMREHKGWLYLGGLTNNRIGRYKLPEGSCDPDFDQFERKWGAWA